MNIKNIAISGIILCFIYFLTVTIFVISGSQNWLIIFEIVTMISGIYFVILILFLPLSNNEKKRIYKILAIIFVTALMVFTNLVHIINLTIICNKINVPNHFQLGKMPSIITLTEYFGWGIFMGLAFMFSSIGIENEIKLRPIKITLLICSILCFISFFGSLINENLWYIAPLGYGIGTLIICIENLLLERNKKVKNQHLTNG